MRYQDLKAAYQQMAEDGVREAEALEWAEALILDAGDEADETQIGSTPQSRSPATDV